MKLLKVDLIRIVIYFHIFSIEFFSVSLPFLKGFNVPDFAVFYGSCSFIYQTVQFCGTLIKLSSNSSIRIKHRISKCYTLCITKKYTRLETTISFNFDREHVSFADLEMDQLLILFLFLGYFSEVVWNFLMVFLGFLVDILWFPCGFLVVPLFVCVPRWFFGILW